MSSSKNKTGVNFVYNGFQHASNLSLDGSASVLRGGAVQLTNDSNSLMGHAFFDSPVQVVRGNSVVYFSTAFVFDIMTVDHGGGHGLAFVVAASKVLPGASKSIYLGLLRDNITGDSSNHVQQRNLRLCSTRGRGFTMLWVGKP
ncbi:hypothetical protein C2845_PM01G20450 [Panicum miliaceum]|uniref:Legume lectin domain-containing protein n=1 Tax=Panicum miliaceum TaxID=4540 RepID=A0A3L6THR3_PANMI|nr:hypothetical protein C2845_PM01G20450 [Panicum miliaceum]